MFLDRTDAGKQLARELLAYKNDKNAIICALPRGGVVLGFEIAKALHVPLDIIVPRKIGAPYNPELAIGAITEDGIPIINHELIQELGVSKQYIAQEAAKEAAEAQRRLSTYRNGRPPCDLSEKNVIIVDDGIATGATMQAALQTAKAKGAKKIIIAVPVAPPEALDLLRPEVDSLVCLSKPRYFPGVGSFYQFFPQVEDDEVITLLNKANSTF